jgi:3-(3-hydroxy-phenyl)propionate hydroxylase
MSQLDGGFVLAVFCDGALPSRDVQSALQALRMAAVPVKAVLVAGPQCDVSGLSADLPVVTDVQGWLAKRYDAEAGTAYLIRPDQHIAARWRAFNAEAVAAAVKRATGHA